MFRALTLFASVVVCSSFKSLKDFDSQFNSLQAQAIGHYLKLTKKNELLKSNAAHIPHQTTANSYFINSNNEDTPIAPPDIVEDFASQFDAFQSEAISQYMKLANGNHQLRNSNMITKSSLPLITTSSYFVIGSYGGDATTPPPVCFYDVSAPPQGVYVTLNHCFPGRDGHGLMYTADAFPTNTTLYLNIFPDQTCSSTETLQLTFLEYPNDCTAATDATDYHTAALTSSLPEGFLLSTYLCLNLNVSSSGECAQGVYCKAPVYTQDYSSNVCIEQNETSSAFYTCDATYAYEMPYSGPATTATVCGGNSGAGMMTPLSDFGPSTCGGTSNSRQSWVCTDTSPVSMPVVAPVVAPVPAPIAPVPAPVFSPVSPTSSYFVIGSYGGDATTPPPVCFYDVSAPPVGVYVTLNHCFPGRDGHGLMYTAASVGTIATLYLNIFPDNTCSPPQNLQLTFLEYPNDCTAATDATDYHTAALTSSLPEGFLLSTYLCLNLNVSSSGECAEGVYCNAPVYTQDYSSNVCIEQNETSSASYTCDATSYFKTSYDGPASAASSCSGPISSQTQGSLSQYGPSTCGGSTNSRQSWVCTETNTVPTDPPVSSSSSSSSLSAGAIAGIVIGVLVGVGIIAGGIWFFYNQSPPTPLEEGLTRNPMSSSL